MVLRRALLAALPLLTLAACADDVTTAPAAPPERASLERASLAAAAHDAGQANVFPDVLPLPNGFSPEGIEFGAGLTYFVGAIPNGAIWRGNALTGAGSVLVAARPDRQASGLEYDVRRDRLFVAGGLLGQANVYDANSGAELASYQLFAPFTGLVNDAVLTKDAVYFTDSFNARLFKLPLGAGGALPAPAAVQTIPLVGVAAPVPGQVNFNGIEATPDGKTLLVIDSQTGTLYRVDPATGQATAIPIVGGPLFAGDGILLDGKELYVVQGAFNQIAVVKLNASYTSGTVERTITSGSFAFPTTIAEFGTSLYAVNGHFDVAPPPGNYPGQAFEVVRVSKK